MKRKICIIQPPPSFSNKDCCLPSEYIGVGLLALSAYLKSRGHFTRIIHFPNAFLDGLSFGRVMQEISIGAYDLFAIGLNWVHFSAGAIEIASELKRRFPGTPVVLGGQHASLFADSLAGNFAEIVDAVIVGEAEIALSRIADELAAGIVPDGIPGVFTKTSRVAPDAGSVIEDIDSLPFQSFAEIWPAYRRPLAAVSTMRGPCPFNCIYCLEGAALENMKRRRRQHHSADYIAEQIARFYAEGKHIITIQDQFSTRGGHAAEELSHLLMTSGVKLSEFNLFAEPGAFGDSGLAALGAVPADIVSIDYGVETSPSHVSDIAGTTFKSKDFVTEIRSATRAGVLPFTWWMIGFPREGPDEIEATRAYIINTMTLGAIPRWVTPLILFPQTEMAVNQEKYGVTQRLKSFADFARFSLEPRNSMGFYPTLGTHDTDLMDHIEIAQAAIELKKIIIDNWPVLDEFYSQTPSLYDIYRRRTVMLGTTRETLFPLDSFL